MSGRTKLSVSRSSLSGIGDHMVTRTNGSGQEPAVGFLSSKFVNDISVVWVIPLDTALTFCEPSHIFNLDEKPLLPHSPVQQCLAGSVSSQTIAYRRKGSWAITSAINVKGELISPFYLLTRVESLSLSLLERAARAVCSMELQRKDPRLMPHL